MKFYVKIFSCENPWLVLFLHVTFWKNSFQRLKIERAQEITIKRSTTVLIIKLPTITVRVTRCYAHILNHVQPGHTINNLTLQSPQLSSNSQIYPLNHDRVRDCFQQKHREQFGIFTRNRCHIITIIFRIIRSIWYATLDHKS